MKLSLRKLVGTAPEDSDLDKGEVIAMRMH